MRPGPRKQWQSFAAVEESQANLFAKARRHVRAAQGGRSRGLARPADDPHPADRIVEPLRHASSGEARIYGDSGEGRSAKSCFKPGQEEQLTASKLRQQRLK